MVGILKLNFDSFEFQVKRETFAKFLAANDHQNE